MGLTRQAVYAALEGTSEHAAARRVPALLDAFISLNVIALIVGTVNEIHVRAPLAFWTFEIVSVAIFTSEYALRIWASGADPKYGNAVSGRLRYIVSPMALVDLAAIAPFYLGLLQLVGIDLRFLRAIRLMARMIRLASRTSAIGTLWRVFHSKLDELLATVGMLTVLLIMASSMMYFIEHEAQPEVFSSIPETMWWAIVTLTTVGYGDMAPVTIPGRILGGAIAVLGIGMFALPAGILGSGFMDDVGRRSQRGDRNKDPE